MEYINLPIGQLIEWDKNPRSISPQNFEQLKVKLYNKKQFKPLLVTPTDNDQYIVLAGNMRLKAYRELSVPTLWVKVLTFQQQENGEWIVFTDGEEEKERFATKEDAMMDWSLSENERAGQYDMDTLTNEMGNYSLDWNSYQLDTFKPMAISDILKEHGIGDEIKEPRIPQKVQCPSCKYEFELKGGE